MKLLFFFAFLLSTLFVHSQIKINLNEQSTCDTVLFFLNGKSDGYLPKKHIIAFNKDATSIKISTDSIKDINVKLDNLISVRSVNSEFVYLSFKSLINNDTSRQVIINLLVYKKNNNLCTIILNRPKTHKDAIFILDSSFNYDSITQFL